MRISSGPGENPYEKTLSRMNTNEIIEQVYDKKNNNDTLITNNTILGEFLQEEPEQISINPIFPESTDDIQKWKNEQWKKITQGKRTFSEVSLDENSSGPGENPYEKTLSRMNTNEIIEQVYDKKNNNDTLITNNTVLEEFLQEEPEQILINPIFPESTVVTINPNNIIISRDNQPKDKETTEDIIEAHQHINQEQKQQLNHCEIIKIYMINIIYIIIGNSMLQILKETLKALQY